MYVGLFYCFSYFINCIIYNFDFFVVKYWMNNFNFWIFDGIFYCFYIVSRNVKMFDIFFFFCF